MYVLMHTTVLNYCNDFLFHWKTAPGSLPSQLEAFFFGSSLNFFLTCIPNLSVLHLLFHVLRAIVFSLVIVSF